MYKLFNKFMWMLAFSSSGLSFLGNLALAADGQLPPSQGQSNQPVQPSLIHPYQYLALPGPAIQFPTLLGDFQALESLQAQSDTVQKQNLQAEIRQRIMLQSRLHLQYQSYSQSQPQILSSLHAQMKFVTQQMQLQAQRYLQSQFLLQAQRTMQAQQTSIQNVSQNSGQNTDIPRDVLVGSAQIQPVALPTEGRSVAPSPDESESLPLALSADPKITQNKSENDDEESVPSTADNYSTSRDKKLWYYIPIIDFNEGLLSNKEKPVFDMHKSAKLGTAAVLGIDQNELDRRLRRGKSYRNGRKKITFIPKMVVDKLEEQQTADPTLAEKFKQRIKIAKLMNERHLEAADLTDSFASSSTSLRSSPDADLGSSFRSTSSESSSASFNSRSSPDLDLGSSFESTSSRSSAAANKDVGIRLVARENVILWTVILQMIESGVDYFDDPEGFLQSLDRASIAKDIQKSRSEKTGARRSSKVTRDNLLPYLQTLLIKRAKNKSESIINAKVLADLPEGLRELAKEFNDKFASHKLRKKKNISKLGKRKRSVRPEVAEDSSSLSPVAASPAASPVADHSSSAAAPDCGPRLQLFHIVPSTRSVADILPHISLTEDRQKSPPLRAASLERPQTPPSLKVSPQKDQGPSEDPWQDFDLSVGTQNSDKNIFDGLKELDVPGFEGFEADSADISSFLGN